MKKIISFICIVNNLKLNAWLHLPDNPRPSLVIGSHGLYSSGSSPKQIALADALNDRGIAYIRFDHRGTGQSDGDFNAETSVVNRTRDLVAIHNHARLNFDLGPKLGLFGSSMGGATCLNAYTQLQPNAVVTFATPVASTDVLPRDIRNDLPEHSFFANSNKSFNLQPQLADIKNILIVHSTADTTVPPAQAQIIYDTVQQPKKLIWQENGDHNMSAPEHQTLFLHEAVQWFMEKGLI